jgi:vacuolar protein sorting-associated protein 53
MLYCDLLKSKLPKSDNANSIGSSDLRLIGRIVNTCEYCIETIPHMKENIVQALDSSFEERVDFEGELEGFQVLINQAIDPLINFIINQLAVALGNMERMNWGVWDSVGDSSAYIGEIKSTLQMNLSQIVDSMSSENHSYLCRKLVEGFIPRYIDSICRCK